MERRTIFVPCSIFAVSVLFSSVIGSAGGIMDVTLDEQVVRISAGPSEVNASVGETVRLNCTSAPPNNHILRWARADNASLPQTAEDQDGVLIIRDADRDASGVYVCNAVSVNTNNTISNASFVTVNIVESDNNSERPTLNIEPERQIIWPGSLVVIRCSSPTHPNATIKWRKADDELAGHVQISNNEIRIPTATVKDGGIYICECANAVGVARVSSKLEIHVCEPPVIEIFPEPNQKVEIDGSTSIECRILKGIPWPRIRWLRRGQRISSSRVFEVGSVLHFARVTDEDGGEYTCSAENAVGSMDAIAVLEIISRQVINGTSEEQKVLPLHAAVNISCFYDNSNGSSKNISYKWEREYGRAFSSRVEKWQNTLSIRRVEHDDKGRYRCVGIDSTAGHKLFSKTFNLLVIDEQPTAVVNNETTIEIVSSLNEAKVGDTLHLTCKVKGDASASTVWMRADGDLEKNVQTRDDLLIITDMQIANARVYRCIAFTRTGFKFMDYHLNNIEILTSDGGDIYAVANVTKKSVRRGHSVDLVCDTHLDPPVHYSWIIHSFEKSLRKIVPNTRTLTVTNASVNNSGIYFCKAVSSRATLRLATALTVEDESSILAFAGNSYLALPPITVDSPERNDIEIHFKPKSDSGLILYTRLKHYYNPRWRHRDDFISFGLYDSFPEFRYDVGIGAIKLRGDTPLQMNKWHKVVLFRNKWVGFMQVNGASNFTGSSAPDRYSHPNSSLPLFVGGHPNYTYITTRTYNPFNTGFDGCIGKLLINSKKINLEKEALSKENVTSCDDCNPNPCLNDGFCQKTTSSLDYHYCICKPGYSGDNCQSKKDTCYADSCGTGQCLENEDGIECLCPVGKSGKRCEKRIYFNVAAPSTKTSSLA